jgi:hypothetical protein
MNRQENGLCFCLFAKDVSTQTPFSRRGMEVLERDG